METNIGAFAGYNYWFPKAFGFRLNEPLGKAAFWCWFVGFYLAFMPLYLLGLMGATRRMQHYDDPTWQPLMIVALCGAVLILGGIVFTVLQLILSIRNRDQNLDETGDPWNGRTLEWSTTSPPPAWNYAVLPKVTSLDAFWKTKQDGADQVNDTAVQAIDVPKNTMIGITLSFFAVVLGFAMIWHIWWMAILGGLGLLGACLIYAWRTSTQTEISAEELSSNGMVQA